MGTYSTLVIKKALDEFIKGIESVAKTYSNATKSIVSDSKELQNQAKSLNDSIEGNKKIASETVCRIKAD